MEITGKVWCFFEQSGTFKNEFKKLGYEAVDRYTKQFQRNGLCYRFV